MVQPADQEQVVLASARIRLAVILGGLLVGPVIATALVITRSPLCITALS